ncbi:MAG: hypothetical protein QW275_00060 [Candidatus Anstonellaceae archaeon]
MLNQNQKTQSEGYSSFDSLFAMAISIFVFFSFASLLHSSSSLAKQTSNENSGELLALRISDYFIEQAGDPSLSHFHANHMDRLSLANLDLEELSNYLGKNYISASIIRQDEVLISTSFGSAEGEIYCASRLVEFEGEISTFKVCVS